ncbi:MAG: RNA polymerase sigma factor [Phycisphaerales bacterium]|nr:RNA polymerase sigma factor [Phycisphaerales bacterium]
MTRIIRSIASNLLPRLSTGEVLVLDDAAALDRYAKAGDPRAFEVLVHRYQSMVVHTCQRVMKSPADAEDAAQETFLKLARRAGEIRSNVAAWLHACALRTSIDILRARGTQRRAEAGIVDVDAQASDDAERTWREIKPLLDDAIAALTESDRDLIVSRFLVGRPQVEMAREAGVNPGTMHRRIDAALEKLRKELSKRGVAPAMGLGATGAVGAVAGASALGNSALASALAHASAGPVSASLTSSLMSVGLAEMGTGAAGVGVGTVVGGATIGLNLGTLALASILGLGTIGGGLWFFGKSGHTMLAATALAPTPEKTGGFERPTAPTRPARLVSETNANRPEVTITHEGDTIHLRVRSPDNVHKEDAVFRILSVGGDQVPNKAGYAKGTMRVRIESWTSGMKFMSDALVGKERDGRFEVEGNLLTFNLRLDVKPPEPEPGKQQTMSIPEEARMVVVREKPPAPNAPVAKIPAMAGEWGFINDCQLQIDKDFITLSWLQSDGSAFPAIKVRVLEWENTGPYVKIQGIFTANEGDMGLVGKRVKLLARRDAKGWTVVRNEAKGNKLNEWPTGFEGKVGEVVVSIFQDGAK